ncbi:hypothetical protein ACLB2K_022006 [Fragaria x ananassa]
MAGEDLNQKLNELISSLQKKGILDDYFDQVKGLQDEKSPQFVKNTITTYLCGAEDTIAELTETLSELAVNYQRVNYLADKLKGSSMCVGGSQMADVCAELCDASEANHREACKELCGVVKREYSTLKDSLNKIVKLEQAIYDERSKETNE